MPRPDGLPDPVTRTEMYLAALLDRLPERPPPVSTPEAGQVELTEPATTTKPRRKPQPTNPGRALNG